MSSSQGFLEQTRQEIIEQRNTAQAQMESLIRHQISSSKQALTELRFPDSLSGDIHFARLPIDMKIALKNVTALSFVKGEITSIQGWTVMTKLQTVEAPDNFLVQLGFEVKSMSMPWKTLNVKGNGLENIEWNKLDHLKEANVSFNQLKKIERLPKTLEILHCEHNQIEFLNLSQSTKLTYCNSSRNSPHLILVPPPTENNAELINDQEIPVMEAISNSETKTTEEETEEASTRKIEYQEALEIYFDAKQKYEKNIKDKKLEIWGKPSQGRKEARRQRIRSLVPQCIHCKQPGGTVFSFKDNHYIAHCAAANPCALDIKLFRGGPYLRFFDAWKDNTTILEEDKQKYIALQHDIEYGYVDELQGLKIEKELKEEYEKSKVIVQQFQTQYDEMYSEERKEAIRTKQTQIYETIAQNEALLSDTQSQREEDEDEEERNQAIEQRIETVVVNEIESLFPTVRALRRMVYDSMEVVKEYREEYLKPISEKEARMRLFQEKIALDQFDLSVSNEPPAVVKFVGF